jgi:hypothetical protein
LGHPVRFARRNGFGENRRTQTQDVGMLRISGHGKRACDGIARRELLRVGGLSLLEAVTLPRFLRAAASQREERPASARAVILLNLFGGPSHLDMFDMKPAAPANVRGEFQPIETSVPGLGISELMPQIARRMHRATLIRTHSHPYNSHNPYNVMTGFTGGNDRDDYFSKPTDHPSMGSVLQHVGIRARDVPTYFMMPAHPGYSQSLRRSGPYGGYLGSRYDPVVTLCDPAFARDANPDKNAYDPIPPIGAPLLPSVDILPEISAGRMSHRRGLLEQIDRQTGALERSGAIDRLDHFQQEAFALLTSSRTRDAFDLSREPPPLRDRYGRDLFGSSLLTARRLVEAGAKFIAVTTESKGAGHWDTHENNFGMMKAWLQPSLDQWYAALTDDLADRGLLDSTLVVVMGEMGRGSLINGKAGRDHWPQCGFVLLTGGGVKQGLVFGKSDSLGKYPVDHPVSSGDIVATIYQLLGVDPHLTVNDLSGRPMAISHGGEPIAEVIA